MRSYEIPKKVVLEASEKEREQRAVEGIDEVSLKEFEADLDNNLYKIWNRMSSGSYFPPPVKAIEIEKKSGREESTGNPHSWGQSSPDGSQNLSQSPGRSTLP